MSEKVIIFDASTLITLAMNGLLEELRGLKKIFNGKFIIPLGVKSEIIDRPITIKRFELEALKLKQLLDEKVIELPTSVGIKSSDVLAGTNKILEQANSTFLGRGKPVHIVDLGESACLALSELLTKNKIENIVAIDERTTRLLCEKPENLEELLRKKLHTNVISNKENYQFFKEFKIIRSSELVYLAFKKNLVKLKDGDKILDALLYAVKFKGCSISEQEIEEIKKLR
jgi:hypothetical protein